MCPANATPGRGVVNPLYVIYGCFDTTGAALKCADGSSCGPTRSTSGTPASPSKPKPPTAARKAEHKALQKAEKEAGHDVRSHRQVNTTLTR